MKPYLLKAQNNLEYSSEYLMHRFKERKYYGD